MDKPRGKKILSVCIIAITLLCTLIIRVDFIAESYSDYHNSITESSYEPLEIEKIGEVSSYRIAPPSLHNGHKHKALMCERKISVLHDALITIENEIKNSDTDKILSILSENNKAILYDVITYLGRFIS